MSKHYRIIFECYETSTDQQEALSKTVMMSGSIEKPVDVFNFGLEHQSQIELVHACQNALLKEQLRLLDAEETHCPNCPEKKLSKFGNRHSDYHDIFTDHKLC